MKLKVLKDQPFLIKLVKKSILTDFALCNNAYYRRDPYRYKDILGYYWTKSYYNNYIYFINNYGCSSLTEYHQNDGNAIRLTLPYDNLDINKYVVNTNGDIKIIKYGMYPQDVVGDAYIDFILSEQRRCDALRETGYTYTINGSRGNYFTPQKLKVYTYENNQYVDVPIKHIYRDNDFLYLSDGSPLRDNESVFIKVSPVTWYVDELKKILISEKLLIANIPFSLDKNYDGNFEKTFIYEFINNYIKPEMFQNITPITTNTITVSKERAYPHINERMQEIKRRVKKLQERR